MPRNNRSRRIERLENILAAALGVDEDVADLERIARHPVNVAALRRMRQRLQLIKTEAQALYQDEATRAYQSDAS